MSRKFINPNTYAVHIQDEEGADLIVEPFNFQHHPGRVYVVSGDHFEKFAKMRMLAEHRGDLPVSERPQKPEPLEVEEDETVEVEEPIVEETPEEDVVEEDEIDEEEAEEEDEKPVVDYTSFRKHELQEMCAERELGVHGNKDDLIARLVVDDEKED